MVDSNEICWESIKVGDLGRIVTGKTPKTSQKENYGGVIPFITPSDDMNVKFLRNTSKTLTEIGASSVRGSIIPKGSICVSCIGSDLGKVVITTETSVTNQQINSIIVDESRFDIDYVYYAMLILGKVLNHNSKTSTAVPIVNKSSFSNYSIPCPDLNTQKKISSVLASFDAKIENNNQINGNLLEQAKAIYKSWFMDFNPTDGIMPTDWHVGTVDEIIELHDSKRKPLSGNEREKLAKIYPYYGATSIMDYVDRYIFDGVYLLLGEDGSVIDEEGYPVLQYVFGKFWPNNHAHIISGKNGFSVESLYLLFSMTNVNHIVTGAVQLKISQQNLKKVEVVVPSEKALKDFDCIIQPMFQQIRALRMENERLISLRDSLLPKLMSGELDVSEIEL